MKIIYVIIFIFVSGFSFALDGGVLKGRPVLTLDGNLLGAIIAATNDFDKTIGLIKNEKTDLSVFYQK